MSQNYPFLHFLCTWVHSQSYGEWLPRVFSRFSGAMQVRNQPTIFFCWLLLPHFPISWIVMHIVYSEIDNICTLFDTILYKIPVLLYLDEFKPYPTAKVDIRSYGISTCRQVFRSHLFSSCIYFHVNWKRLVRFRTSFLRRVRAITLLRSPYSSFRRAMFSSPKNCYNSMVFIGMTPDNSPWTFQESNLKLPYACHFKKWSLGVSTLPNITCAVMSHPLSKWDQV